ncbi:MAG: 4-hydroxybutyrate CoA-transferase [Proteobacteria bacterium]|nr:4-hydroxybutyrate CoA-transferase [Pseudomonadota bacterium]
MGGDGQGAWCSPADAALRVRDRDTLGIPLGPGQPSSLLHALGQRDRFESLRVFGALLVDLFPVFARPGVTLYSGFFGPAERALAAAGHDVQFVPADFRRFTGILEQLRPRVMATAVAPPDANGRLSLALHAGATVRELAACARDPERLLVAEVQPDLPRTLGLPPAHPHSLAVEEVDVLIEGDRPPLVLPEPEASDSDRAIADHVRPYIHDGCTLQTGIGAVPSTVASLLAEGDGGDYGVHSEMFTDGLMRLHQAGKVTNRKGRYDGVSVTTFALGSRELYRWLDGREEVRFLPVEAINTPSEIARNRDMVTINGAIAVDLFGQVAADTRAGQQYSGIGGHEDFIAGTGFSLEGRSLVCLPSTARTGAERRSRIEPALGAGSLVTTPRHQLDVVITEYGAAELFGRSVEERAQALIAVAHPDFRDELVAAWKV